MRTRYGYMVGGFAVTLACFFSQAVFAQDQLFVKERATIGQEYVPGELIVKFKPGISEGTIAQLVSRLGTAVFSTSRFAGFKRLRVLGTKTVAEMVEQFSQDPSVEYAEPNYIAHAFLVPNDPYYSYQWHMRGINMEKAWDLTAGHSSVTVAVVDTGVAYEDYSETALFMTRRYYKAPDLAQTQFVPGYDFVNNDAHPNDDEGHGTHVTGTIAQSTNNALGVAGVAFNTSIMPVKVLDQNGSGTYADVADGIRFSADTGADVISLSLGGSADSTTLRDAVAYAYGKGSTLVCASGNDGSATTISFPAAYEACIAVGATRYDETVAYYSNRGAALDLVAPGGDLRVDQNGDGYGDGVLQQTFGNSTNDWGYWFYSGTSMATPHVSGAAALLLAYGVATSPNEVRDVLQATAKDLGPPGWDPTYGHGLLDAYAALIYSPTPNTAPVAQAGGPYTGTEDVAVSFDGSGSYDPNGDPLTYAWNFGDGATGTGMNPTHTYTAGGMYTVTLVVNDGKVNSDPSVTTAEVAEVSEPSIEVFFDSFEVSTWNGLWTEDSQDDWFRSTQRAKDGRYSAEVDGYASDAKLISKPIDLQGRTNATVTFSWYIESRLDTGEYLAFDISTDGGTTWVEKARLRGNVDPEDAWHAVSLDLTTIPKLRLRFRGKMSDYTEDADVDVVRVTAW